MKKERSRDPTLCSGVCTPMEDGVSIHHSPCGLCGENIRRGKMEEHWEMYCGVKKALYKMMPPIAQSSAA